MTTWQGKAWSRTAWLAGLGRLGSAGQGLASHGQARRVVARLGRRGEVRLVKPRCGMARQAGRVSAWHVVALLGQAGHGMARQARHGETRLGSSRHGQARPGLAGE